MHSAEEMLNASPLGAASGAGDAESLDRLRIAPSRSFYQSID